MPCGIAGISAGFGRRSLPQSSTNAGLPLPPWKAHQASKQHQDTHTRVPHTRRGLQLQAFTDAHLSALWPLSQAQLTQDSWHAVGHIQHRELRAGSLHEQTAVLGWQGACSCVSELQVHRHSICGLMAVPRTSSQCLTFGCCTTPSAVLHTKPAKETHLHTPVQRLGPTHASCSRCPCACVCGTSTRGLLRTTRQQPQTHTNQQAHNTREAHTAAHTPQAAGVPKCMLLGWCVAAPGSV